MITVELTKEELNNIILMMDNSQVSMAQAERAAVLYKKFTEAKE